MPLWSISIGQSTQVSQSDRTALDIRIISFGRWRIVFKWYATMEYQHWTAFHVSQSDRTALDILIISFGRWRIVFKWYATMEYQHWTVYTWLVYKISLELQCKEQYAMVHYLQDRL